MTRILIVGSGFVGTRIAAQARLTGDEPVLASRHAPSAPTRGEPVPPSGAPSGLARGEPVPPSGSAADEPGPASGALADLPWVWLDVTDPVACAGVVDRVRPDAVLAVHGPSDVTWCERHSEEALRAHRDAAAHLVRAAGTARLLMISTDNVFDGVAETNDEHAPVAPANAYGRAKLAAEAALGGHPDATVLRVSLVHGDQPPGLGRLNFAASCLRELRAGRQVEVPRDQWTTPVHVDDVARVALAALRSGPRLLHLGGPDRVSRVEWAHLIADRAGAPRDLITPVSRSAGPYACRPANSCLSSRLLPGLLKEWGLRVRGVEEGVEALVATPS